MESLGQEMADSNELIVIVKMYDLIKWSCETISRFPRNYRFVLGERIETNLLDILELLIAAKFSKDRIALLTKTNLRLEILRHEMRLAKDLECLRLKSYLFSAGTIDEIGRLVGGWLKSPTKATP